MADASGQPFLGNPGEARRAARARSLRQTPYEDTSIDEFIKGVFGKEGAGGSVLDPNRESRARANDYGRWAGIATDLADAPKAMVTGLGKAVVPTLFKGGTAALKGLGMMGKIEEVGSGGDALAAALKGNARRPVPRVMRDALPEGTDFSQYSNPTVKDAQRVTFPGIYKRPDALVAGAQVAPENPLLKQLFGVTRDDLYDIGEQGMRAGNMTERPFKAAATGRGSAAAQQVMTPANEQRMLDIIGEAEKRPDLYKGMSSWYVMDPAYQHFVRLYGPEAAAKEYARFNTLMGMGSPGSEVLTEMNRATAANWLDKQGRFSDFLRHGGTAEDARGAGFPDDMRAILGHPYHSTAQAKPMQKYLQGGELDMQSAKVPSYIHASGVPETGFQTDWPVGDAHWSRLVGLPDVRTAENAATRNASATVPEMSTLGPWWNDRIASQAGLKSVPAQAVVWGAGSNATGVTSPIGAPKLELLAQQIGKASRRMGVAPEEARDLIFMGQGHAGNATPAALGATALGAGGATALANDDDVQANLKQWLAAWKQQQPQQAQQ
jgi:hypothetical protein